MLEGGIRVMVPPSKAGGRLLGELVDLIDALVEEWYPGLLIVSPITGQPAVEIRVPCVSCESKSVKCTNSIERVKGI